MHAAKDTVGCHLLTLHNVSYQLRLMNNIRKAILNDEFPSFIQKFFKELFGGKDNYPIWAVNALKSVNIELFP